MISKRTYGEISEEDFDQVQKVTKNNVKVVEFNKSFFKHYSQAYLFAHNEKKKIKEHIKKLQEYIHFKQYLKF